ncbi:MAG: HAD hydrolase-like protein, partial [Firmicutes bacterium]|nr:HAD hydrolase-like protein [Bacillota bacterium]
MAKIKAVLFDFDGTLMDTNQLILDSWYHVFDTYGMD